MADRAEEPKTALEELVNTFVFQSTIRSAIIIKKIQTFRETMKEEGRESQYEAMCNIVLHHTNDIRLMFDVLEMLSLAQSEKEALKACLGLLTSEKIIYNMGHALIEMKGIQMVSNINTCFIRRTKKFWVYPENVETIIAIIARHLPVYIFGDDGSGKISSSISSVYFDTPQFYLYRRRMRREQKAKSLRIRKYGESSIIAYVELKTHEDGWTGEKSTKQRFLIHAQSIISFAQGVDIWEDIKSINSPEAHKLYLEVAGMIKDLELVPVVKTLYTRTAFQFPDSSSVRISIDRNLSMWNGTLGKLFPYAVLEVKLEEDSNPEWVQALMNSSLVIPVDKFSKYLHGCAVHYEEVPVIPYWYNQIGQIVKQSARIDPVVIEDPRVLSLNETVTQIIQQIAQMQAGAGPETQDLQEAQEVHQTSVSVSDNHNNTTAIQNNSATNTEQTMNTQENSQMSAPRHKFFDPSSINPPRVPAVPETRSDKPVVIPVRVEPKVFFANERTFLSWLHFAIFIGGIGAALMGLGDYQAALSGVCFIIVSVVFSLYALYLYIWRARRIKMRDPGPYDDHSGPVILVAVFLSAMVTSIFFKFPLK
ncbi:hypothetical protein NECID01_1194 [Nematocida sp. AWRm77]|nr:hypothetical protein NECID01_1194 [Nematocida sp. AWRm77]